MNDFERKMETLLNELDIEQITILVEAAKKKQSQMERKLANAAKQKFIKAYTEFRQIAPSSTAYIDWEYDNINGDYEEQDFDLYEMLDAAIHRGIIN